jgi:CubicO group peptidase (beta-lactamase class C family)
MKRLLPIALALLAWSGVTMYGAVEGWWLRPIAPRGDAPAFMTAATRIASAESHGTIAMVLLTRGEVVGEHYQPSIDTVNRETRFPLASMSKVITAYAVMQLVQAGRIDLDAPVATYLRQWQLPAGAFDAKGVTVRRLLSHTAGLTDGLGFADYLPTESLPSLSNSLRQPRASSGPKAIDAHRVVCVPRYAGPCVAFLRRAGKAGAHLSLCRGGCDGTLGLRA